MNVQRDLCPAGVPQGAGIRSGFPRWQRNSSIVPCRADNDLRGAWEHASGQRKLATYTSGVLTARPGLLSSGGELQHHGRLALVRRRRCACWAQTVQRGPPPRTGVRNGPKDETDTFRETNARSASAGQAARSAVGRGIGDCPTNSSLRTWTDRAPLGSGFAATDAAHQSWLTPCHPPGIERPGSELPGLSLSEAAATASTGGRRNSRTRGPGIPCRFPWSAGRCRPTARPQAAPL